MQVPHRANDTKCRFCGILHHFALELLITCHSKEQAHASATGNRRPQVKNRSLAHGCRKQRNLQGGGELEMVEACQAGCSHLGAETLSFSDLENMWA